MRKSLLMLSLPLYASIAQAQTTDTQAFLTLKSFECVQGARDCSVNQSLYSSLKEALQKSNRFRIFEDQNVSELTLSGAITDVRQVTTGILGFTETTLIVKVSVELKDHVSSEVLWAGNFEGNSKAGGANFFGIQVQESNSVAVAAASVANQVTSQLLTVPALKGYLTHQPGERAIPRQAAVPQNTPQQGNTFTPQPAGNASVGSSVELFLLSLKTLNFSGLNSLLTDDYVNSFALEGLQKQITAEAVSKASQVQYRYQLQSQSPQVTTLNLGYTLPGQGEKLISLTLMDASVMQMPGKTGMRVVYFAPTSPYASAINTMPMFKVSVDGLTQLLADVKAFSGIN
ncbi:hypothetical protein [Deinococcus roseus]|uniref:Curli production assembly/transport component CsgG n=1 Tax=Deinococcus roseus TaxID=392414 RepID=A0ABQ2D6S9_9DEIO|nr:hypothetical protein [Deinococcus roseus]GGJ47902.1 hypothetical protein GCM10008938_37380 [Deinococcus roseus]